MNAAELRDQAGHEYSHGRYGPALKLVNQALAIAPMHYECLILKGHIFSDLGKRMAAIRCYNKAIRIDPKRAEAYWAKACGLNCHFQRDLPATLRLLDQAFKCLRKDETHLAELLISDYVEALNAAGYPLKSLEVVNCGLNHPAVIDGDYLRLDRRIVRNAIRDNARKKDSRGFGFWKHTKMARSRNNAPRKLASTLPALLSRASKAYQRGRYTTALNLVNKALAKFPADYHALVLRGNVLSETGRMPEANACYDSAIKLSPKRPEAYWSKALGIRKVTARNLSRKLDLLIRSRKFLRSQDAHLAGLLFEEIARTLHTLERFSEALKFVEQGLRHPAVKDKKELRELNKIIMSWNKSGGRR